MSTLEDAASRRTAIVLLVAVVAGAAAFGATYVRTLSTWRDDAAVAELGAGVRVRLEPAPSEDASFAQAARTLPTTRWITPMRTVPFTSAGGGGALVAVAPESEASDDPGFPEWALDLPWTSSVSISVGSDAPLPAEGAPQLRVWFADEAGDLVVVDPGAAPGASAGDTRWTWTVDVPGDPIASFWAGDPRGPTWFWSVAAVDLLVDVDALPDERSTLGIELTQVAADVEVLPGEGSPSSWTVVTFTGDDALRVEAGGDDPLARISASQGAVPQLVRFVPGPTEAPLPIALEREWSEGAALGAGDVTDLVVDGIPVEGNVTETVPVIPGGFEEGHALADIGALNRLLLLWHRDIPAPETVWIDSLDAPLLAALITDPAGTGVRSFEYADYEYAVDKVAQGVVDVTVAERTTAARPPIVTWATYVVGAAAVLVVVWNTAALLLLRARSRGEESRASGSRLSTLPAACLVGMLVGLALAQVLAPPLVELTDATVALPAAEMPEPIVVVAALLLAASEARRAIRRRRAPVGSGSVVADRIRGGPQPG